MLPTDRWDSSLKLLPHYEARYCRIWYRRMFSPLVNTKSNPASHQWQYDLTHLGFHVGQDALKLRRVRLYFISPATHPPQTQEGNSLILLIDYLPRGAIIHDGYSGEWTTYLRSYRYLGSSIVYSAQKRRKPTQKIFLLTYLLTSLFY